MAKERIVSQSAQVAEAESDLDPQTLEIRPRTLGEYVGQRALVERLTIALTASKSRGEAMEHVLLHGPPGLGKTTLAHVIAHEMGSRAYVTSGPALSKAGDLVGTLTKMEENDVLFIDEIHRLPAAVEEYIYPAMEDRRIDFTLDSGMHSRVVTISLKPFTLIGATTRAGLLTQALRSRFGIAHHLEFYGHDDLVGILVEEVATAGVLDFGPNVVVGVVVPAQLLDDLIVVDAQPLSPVTPAVIRGDHPRNLPVVIRLAVIPALVRLSSHAATGF
jgi:Holliday junction DNA helicase RuvB